MKISKQAAREAKTLFRSCFTGGQLDEQKVRLVVSKVLEAKPRGYLPLLSLFQRLVKLEIDRRTARVESAIALDASQQASLTQSLARQYGPGLRVTFAQNPALLGGLSVRVGSDVFDGSVRARLQRLQESF